MKKIAIITSGYFSVPDSMGGAVEHLITLLLRGGERSNIDTYFEVFSCWDEKAYQESRQFGKSSFKFIKTPKYICTVDKYIYRFARYILKKDKAFSYRYILQRIYYLNQVRKKLLLNNYDGILIENHSSLFLPFKDRRVLKKYEGRVFFHLHNAIDTLYGCGREMRSVERVLGISQYVCDEFLDVVPDYDISKLRILKNCLEVEKYGTQEVNELAHSVRIKYGLTQMDQVILFSGRLSEEKGVRELLLAFDQVYKSIDSAKLVIVGSTYYSSGTTSSYENELYRIASRYGDSVIFTGYIPHEQMPSIYAMADICVAPSVWEEPACMAALEAIASGKPLIATRSGGMTEYIDDTFAVLVDRDDQMIRKLANEIIILLNNKDLRLSLATRAREVRSQFSATRYFENFVEIFNEVVPD